MLASALARVSRRGMLTVSRASNTFIERYAFPYEPVPVVAQYAPYLVRVQANKLYEWCSCGHSQTQPWIDGQCLCSKKEQGFRPVLFQSPANSFELLCGCKNCSYRPKSDYSCYLKYMEDFPLMASAYLFAAAFSISTVGSYYFHP